MSDPLTIAGLAPAAATGDRPSPERAAAERAASEFESVFLAQMLRGLFEGVTGEGGLGGADEGAFKEMLQDEYARLISRSGGVGVADMVLREMLKLQEIA